MTAPSVIVRLYGSTASSFFDYFTLDDSLLDGTDVLPAGATAPITLDGVRIIDISRGRAHDLDEFQAGRCAIEFNNDDRRYDPANTDSDLYGSIEPRKVIEVVAVVNSVEYHLFYGYAERWTVDYSDQNLPLAAVTAVDALGIFARQDLPEISAAHTGDLAGARIERVLDRAEVAFPDDRRDIDAGLTVFGDTTYGINAASYLQLAAQSEGGDLFVTSDGMVRFKERNSPVGAVQAVFSDDGDAASIAYLTIDQDASDSLIYNRITTAGTTGNEQTVTDTTSIDAYFVNSLDRTGQLALNDTDMLDQARVLLARFATPDIRLRQVDVRVDALDATRQAELLGLELTERVTVERTPPGGGSPTTLTQAALVEGLAWQITEGGTSWIGTVTFQSGKRAVGFVLDDELLGQLDDDFLT